MRTSANIANTIPKCWSVSDDDDDEEDVELDPAAKALVGKVVINVKVTKVSRVAFLIVLIGFVLFSTSYYY